MKKLSVVETRRKRLHEWIAHKHNGVLAGFVEATEINQGELSGLLKNKSFGEKKARSIEEKAGMPPGWLDTESDITSAPMPDAPNEALAQIIKLSRAVNRMADDLDAALKALLADGHPKRKIRDIPAMTFEFDAASKRGNHTSNGQILKDKKQNNKR